MKASSLTELIAACFKNGLKRTLMIEGPPGGGKTEVTKQAAALLSDKLNKDVGLIVIHAPTMQVEDLGLPVPERNAAGKVTGITFATPSVLPFVTNDNVPDSGILLIDELAQGDASCQKALANLMQERQVHGNMLKDGWHIICTGNRQADRAGANRILSHLANRMTTVELEPDLDDWAKWYMGTDGFRPEGVAFLRWRPDLLLAFDPDQPKSPTPRSWTEGVFSMIGHIPADAELEVFKGAVGEGPAAEFVGFLRTFRHLPSLKSILADPKGVEVPTKSNVLFALAASMAHNCKEDNFDTMMVFVERMPTEYQTVFVKDAISNGVPVHKSKVFAAWALKHQDQLSGY